MPATTDAITERLEEDIVFATECLTAIRVGVRTEPMPSAYAMAKAVVEMVEINDRLEKLVKLLEASAS